MGVKTRISPISTEYKNKNDDFSLKQIEAKKETETENEKNHSLTRKILSNIIRAIGLLTCLYFFIISLDLMSSGFRLLAGLFRLLYYI